MQCIACVCNFKVWNLIVRCDLKKYHFTMGSCSTPGSTTWWSRQFYWDKIQSNPRSPWYIWWFFRKNLTFWGIFKVQFVLPSSIFVSFTSHRSRGVVVCWFVSSLIRAFRSFVRSFVRSLVRWFVGSLVRWFVGWLVGWLVRWFVGSLVRWPNPPLPHGPKGFFDMVKLLGPLRRKT